jgi:hypothetical protein
MMIYDKNKKEKKKKEDGGWWIRGEGLVLTRN